jgi:hypothetical protein
LSTLRKCVIIAIVIKSRLSIVSGTLSSVIHVGITP